MDMYFDIYNCNRFHCLPVHKLKKLHAVLTLEAPPQLSVEPPTNITENQIVTIIIKKMMLYQKP